MSRKLTKSWLLALGVGLFLSSHAAAQDVNPFADPAEFSPWSPPEYDDYSPSLRPARQDGAFARLDYIHYSISAPDAATVGQEGLTQLVYDPAILDVRTQFNTLDTGGYSSVFETGAALEAGVMDDGRGIIFRGFNVNSSNIDVFASDVDVVFVDRPSGVRGLGYLDRFFDFEPRNGQGNNNNNNNTEGDGFDDDLNRNGFFGRDGFDSDGDGTPDTATAFVDSNPDGISGDNRKARVVFDSLSARNSTNFWSGDIMFVIPASARVSSRLPSNWALDWGIGPRYLEWEESFDVHAEGGFFADSDWVTSSKNRLVGPQVNMRARRSVGRITYLLEGRYCAAFNFQSAQQRSTIGSELDGSDVFLSSTFSGGFHGSSSFSANEFSPIYELKGGLEYEVLKGFSLQVGWNAMFVNNIARPSNMVLYRLPDMGINANNNRQDVFVHGVNAGLSFHY